MSSYKKIANAHHETYGSLTTRKVSPHGVSRGLKDFGRGLNRVAKKKDARWHFDSQDGS